MLKNEIILGLLFDQVAVRIEEKTKVSSFGLALPDTFRDLEKELDISLASTGAFFFFTINKPFEDVFRTLINSRFLYEKDYRFIKGEIYN